LTFDFDLQTRPSEGQTRLPCEFGSNSFSGFPTPETFHTQTKKPQTDGAKDRTFGSSLRAVKKLKTKKTEMLRGNGPVIKSVESVMRPGESLWWESERGRS